MLSTGPNNLVRSAVFVDFDNIYSALNSRDRDASAEFAETPEKWLAWMEDELPYHYLPGGYSNRRVLIRRCYMNPAAFRQYRPRFTISGFEVIDCPPLTTGGKTSTDINMVMDIMDTIQNYPHVQEFILLSGDSDFTPIIQRIRKHDRVSVVIATGQLSAAYKASADYLVLAEEFITKVLGINEEVEEHIPMAASSGSLNARKSSLLKRMGTLLEEKLEHLPDGIEASDLPGTYKEIPEFKASEEKWLGFNSLRNLTRVIVDECPNLVFLDGDPWRINISTRVVLEPEKVDPFLLAVEPAGGEAEGTIPGRLTALIQQQVGRSNQPVSLASLAYIAQQTLGPALVAGNWMGKGSFKRLLYTLDLGELKIDSKTPGYIYDPARHMLASEKEGSKLDQFSIQYPELAPLAFKIHQLTDTPFLLPEHYHILFSEIAREVNEHGYQMSQTSRVVRDRCVEKGVPVSRALINFVLAGITFSDYEIAKEGRPETTGQLAMRFYINVMNLCSRVSLELDPAQIDLLHSWLLSEKTNGSNGS